jgi:N-acylneuraminate cytidylyltransferase
MKRLAIIPARGGSKRIPGKNIKDFLGKPIIAYSIEAALATGIFDEVMVSTDDEKIATIARQFGATVPFMRSEKNADDFATTADVIEEVIQEYRNIGQRFDTLCCIYPTAPFVTAERLKEGGRLLESQDYDSVVPMVQFGFPIQRAIYLNETNQAFFFRPEHTQTRSQDLEKAYHDVGQYYWLNTTKFLANKQIWTQNTGAIILDEMEAQDIDTLEDWEIAEFKYQLKHGK